MDSPFGIRKSLRTSYEAALKAVPEALQTEGFGVLTEIDVKETLRQKLNADFRRYKILGACNPALAHRALQRELEVGLMMPCNVIVYEEDGGTTMVEAIDPMQTMAAKGDPELGRIASEVREKLLRVMDRLEGAPASAAGGPGAAAKS